MTKALAVLAALVALTFAGSAASHTSAGYTCNGSIVEFFKGFGTGAARNGAIEPTFSTGGQAYCLTAIQTYHWNGGKGQAPGTLGLKHISGPAGFASVGPFKAVGSAGQNNAPNVNWQSNVPTSPNPTVIDGTYKCTDSDPARWSADTSGGPGYCNVYGILAQGGPPAAAPATPKASAKEVVEPDGRIELIVKNTGTTAIVEVRFRPYNWFIEKLGAVKQKGICTLDGTGQMVCDKNFTIDPGKSIPFTITQSFGTNDGGYARVGDSQLHIVVDVAGPNGSPPPTPPPVTDQSKAKQAVEYLDKAIEYEQEAVAAPVPVGQKYGENYGKNYNAVQDSLKLIFRAAALTYGIEAISDAHALLNEVIGDEHNYFPDTPDAAKRVERALHNKIAALTDIRAFLAKKR